MDKLPDTKARTVILKLKNHFARYGCPDEVVSDNGPQFSCNEFTTFACTWEFQHCTISPGNSKANGKVESAVKTAKRLLRKALQADTDPYLAILDYRNTPTQGIGSGPAQRLMSRRTKTLLPTTNQLLQPQARKQAEEQAKLIERQQKQKWYYDRTMTDNSGPRITTTKYSCDVQSASKPCNARCRHPTDETARQAKRTKAAGGQQRPPTSTCEAHTYSEATRTFKRLCLLLNTAFVKLTPERQYLPEQGMLLC